MSFVLEPFQDEMADALANRYEALKQGYDKLGPQPTVTQMETMRKHDGAILLQAPTGIGKTLIAAEALARFSKQERVLWFWLAPFSGVTDQSRGVIAGQCPSLTVLDLQSDRRPDRLEGTPVFVTTWQSVATRRPEGRRARMDGDLGLAIDTLLEQAREEGWRIGCVVDETHHTLMTTSSKGEARAFFTEVVRPHYALLMSATPREEDAKKLESNTGYQIGDPTKWASLSREDGVRAGLLKTGVKTVRFLADDADDASLADLERTALSQCVQMHRHIKAELVQRGIGVQPLMLVQVPDGGEAIKKAKAHLIEKEGFPETAVRTHTAKEPDSDLLALANDPDVEVLIFKMAVALGFDAPRAWTLAALRGVRDESFGLQIVGRLMRVHPAVRAHPDVPNVLRHGYVFLANAESQEGFMRAGEAINRMAHHHPQLGTQTVVTIHQGDTDVQVVRTGESLQLLPRADTTTNQPPAHAGASDGVDPFAGLPPPSSGAPLPLFQGGDEEDDPQDGRARPHRRSQLVSALDADAQRAYHYPRSSKVPGMLSTEFLPHCPENLDKQVTEHIRFDEQALLDRERSRVRLRREERDILNPDEASTTAEREKQVWADVAPEEVARRVQDQQRHLGELDQRFFPSLLLERFTKSLQDRGLPIPDDEELLSQQLDLVLVRNPRLLRDAYRRVRMEQVSLRNVALPEHIVSEVRLPPAERNAYGVFPAGLNADEQMVAEALDRNEAVAWWHRNSVRRPDSVGLYDWDEGDGFFPDFVAAISGRETKDEVVLIEVKGAHLMHFDQRKASASHREYGPVAFVGKNARGEMRLWRHRKGVLDDDGLFEVHRLRWL